MSNLNLPFGYLQRRNNGRLFPKISDCGVACTAGRRILRLARLHPFLGGAPMFVLGPGCVKTCAHEKRVELFSPLSYPGNRRWLDI